MKRPLRIIRNYGSHDPLAVPGAVWIGRDDSLPTPDQWFSDALRHATQSTPAPEPPLPQMIAQRKVQLDDARALPPLPPVQHNLHVMAYWSWRLDRLAGHLP